MCHSVEMYLPKLTRDAAERSLAANAAAGRRERAAMDRLSALLAFLSGWVLRTARARAGRRRA